MLDKVYIWRQEEDWDVHGVYTSRTAAQKDIEATINNGYPPIVWDKEDVNGETWWESREPPGNYIIKCKVTK